MARTSSSDSISSMTDGCELDDVGKRYSSGPVERPSLTWVVTDTSL
ncbi:hypothetical protein ACPEIF_27085 [Streptomyces sp. NPDC012600]